MKTSKIMIMSAMIFLIGSMAYADSWIMPTKVVKQELKELKENPIKVSHNQLKWKANKVRKQPINADKLPYGALVR